MKQKIRSAQLRASVAVNQKLVLLYWRIGREIPVRQERESRGCDGIKRDLAGLNLGGRRRAESFTLDVQRQFRYAQCLIRTFSCKKTERLFNREAVKEFANIELAARRRLFALNNARALTDLPIPPGNRLEALERDRARQHSIRINDQYRVCFAWKEDGPHDAEITKHYR